MNYLREAILREGYLKAEQNEVNVLCVSDMITL